MKLLILSDIHGSGYYAEKIVEINKKENPDKIILLGDLYYHGPRNPLPKEYDPMKVSEILNNLKNKIISVKGNCDAEVDEMISEFKLEESISIDINGLKVFFTHGHKYNIDNFSKDKFDVMIYGHFHTGFIKEKDGRIFANPGSIALPKNNTKHSYMILEENNIILKDVNGETIEKLKLNKKQ